MPLGYGQGRTPNLQIDSSLPKAPKGTTEVLFVTEETPDEAFRRLVIFLARETLVPIKEIIPELNLVITDFISATPKSGKDGGVKMSFSAYTEPHPEYSDLTLISMGGFLFEEKEEKLFKVTRFDQWSSGKKIEAEETKSAWRRLQNRFAKPYLERVPQVEFLGYGDGSTR